MPRRTLILLPPSEGKALDGDGPPWAPGTLALPALDAARQRLLAAHDRSGALAAAPTRPAIERYTGVLYRELDAASLPAAARRRLRRDVLTFSGLWGAVAPADPIPHYRLKMSASVRPLGKLSTWWRPQLTDALAPRVRGAVVWDLLPIEHSAGWSPAQLRPAQRLTVRFVDARGATVSHWNKLLKGALVRWLLTTGASDVDALVEMDHPLGYRFAPDESSLDEDPVRIVFREQA